MKKLLMLSLLISLGVFGQANAQTLKIATIAPEASDWMKGMRQGAKEIKERTDGRVTIKLYGGGVQGSDGQVLRKIRIGQLHGGAFTPAVLMDTYKDIGLYNMPMVFNDQAEVDYIRERFDERLIKGLDEAGFVSFGFAATGFSVILSNDPVDSLDDLKNKKVWVPQGDPISESALKSLGLNPAPLPLSDVFTGLQTKLIEIVPGSPIGALVLQWHTKVDYMTDLPLLYTAALTAIDKRAFNRLKPGDQAIVREVMTRLYKEYDAKSAKDDIEAKQALVNSGVKRIAVDPADAAEIRDAVLASNRRMGEEGHFSLDLYDEMLAQIDTYRAMQASFDTESVNAVMANKLEDDCEVAVEKAEAVKAVADKADAVAAEAQRAEADKAEAKVARAEKATAESATARQAQAETAQGSGAVSTTAVAKKACANEDEEDESATVAAGQT